MNLSKFKEMIKLLKEDDEESAKQSECFIQPEIKSKLNIVISLLLDAHFGEEGEEMIMWWLYDTSKKHIYDMQGSIIRDLTTLEALFDYLNEIKNIPDTKNKVVN